MRTFATPTRKRSGARAPAFRGGLPVVSRPHGSIVQRSAIRHILHGPRLQPKLDVGAPDDAYEREADRVAEAVVWMPAPAGRIQRMCPECEEEMRGQPAPRLVLGSGHETRVQRKKCGSRQIGTPAGCTTATGEIEDRLRYLFVVNCDDFRRGNQADLEADAERIQSGDTVELHGFASIEGDPGYNLNLSCARALKAKRVVEAVLSRRGVTATIRVFTHGATPGNRDVQRSVVMTFGRPPTPTPPPEPPPEPPPGPEPCRPAYDTGYGPTSSNCSAYQTGKPTRFLTWTYRHNATCACENTPDDPKNNCVRKCLQVKMAAFLDRMDLMGAAIGSCIDPLGLLDFTCPEPFCSDLYDHHVECYEECCCDNDFIAYPAFWFMCEAPYPCFFVSWTISQFNACNET